MNLVALTSCLLLSDHSAPCFGSAHLHPLDSRAVISSSRRRQIPRSSGVIALAAPTVVGRIPHRVWQRCMGQHGIPFRRAGGRCE